MTENMNMEEKVIEEAEKISKRIKTGEPYSITNRERMKIWIESALHRQRTEGFKDGKNDKTPIEWANHLVKAIENARKEGFEAGRKEVGARGRCSVRKTTLTRQEKMIEAQMDEYVPVGKKDLKVIVASIAAQKKFMLVGAEHTHIKRKEGATNAGRK